MQVSSEIRSGDVAIRPLPDLQTESVLRSILQSIDDGVLLTDLEHRSLACNRRFGLLFGVEPAEVVRIGVEELRNRVAPSIVDADAWRENLRTVYANPTARFEDEIVLRREGDGEVVVRRVASPVYDANGHLMGRLWAFSDVTETHRRRRNAELLRYVSNLANPDPGANLKAICEAVTRHFGAATQLNILEGDFLRFHYNAGDLGPAQFLPGIPRWDTYCGFTLEDDRPLIVQDALLDSRCANLLPATIGFCRYLGVPVRDETGHAIGTLCIVDRETAKPLGPTDVELLEMVAMRANAELARERHLAERIDAQAQRFEAERRDIEETRAVLATMNEVFGGLFGGQTTAELLRGIAERLRGTLGYEASALFLQRPGEASCEVAACSRNDEAAAFFEGEFPNLADCAADETVDGAPLDASFARIDGGEMGRLLGLPWAAVACLPKGDWGEAVVVLGRADEPPRDSARHRVKLLALMDSVRVVLAAHALNSELAQANVALRAAQEKALRSEKLAVVGTLAASTAHDIRNITASLSMLAAETDDPVAALAALREQFDRFNVLAHRLLSYARPAQTESAPVDVVDLLDHVLSLTAGQRRVSRVEAALELDPDLPPAMGDRHQLQHLFVNLVLNAVQAMARKGGRLRLLAAAEGGKVVVRVIDDGPGIPESVAARLFQPFASSRPQGFGLGLFSAKRIVEAHGGALRASANADGPGTTFLVELPIERLASGEARQGGVA